MEIPKQKPEEQNIQGFTPRELELLGGVRPATNKEWAWQQDHANDIIPEKPGVRTFEATTKLFKIVPVGKPLSLHKPQNVKTSWQDEKN